ncbi:hypothetical protein EON79_03575 [bacterium]|nr:MAG: hypothetical protein EON79_03575 [bacterium]
MFLGIAAPVADYKDTWAIVGATIETGAGKIENGTVVVRDGTIVAVGKDLKAPDFARVIDAKGQWVFPGFIDAHSNLGVTPPPISADADGGRDQSTYAYPNMREANRRGIRSELRGADLIALTVPQLQAERRAGFVALNLTAGGNLFNGAGSVVALTGGPRRQTVIAGDTGQFVSFRLPPRGEGGGGYPGSLLGAIAQIRQTFYDVNDTPASVDDPALTNLRNERGHFWFEADTAREIDRALDLLGEAKKPAGIVGAAEGFKMLERLSGVPVIAGVAFGREPRPTPDEPAAASDIRRQQFQDRVGNLSALSKAGVNFAITGRGVTSRTEFWANLRRAITAGLPREKALAGLTALPSQWLGLGPGKIVVGAPARLSVMDKDPFVEEAAARWVFVGDDAFRADRERTEVRPPRVPTEEDLCCGDGTHEHRVGGGN